SPGTGASPNSLACGDNAVLTVELNGAGLGANGLVITAANTTVQGLVINGFGGAGIVLSGEGATGDVVAGNFIGTNAARTAGVGNGNSGVVLMNGAHDNTVGGANAADRNLISGNTGEGVLLVMTDGANTRNNTVRNNYIGTDRSGTVALGNTNS